MGLTRACSIYGKLLAISVQLFPTCTPSHLNLRKAKASLSRGTSSTSIVVPESLPFGGDHVETQEFPLMDEVAANFFEAEQQALQESQIPTAPAPATSEKNIQHFLGLMWGCLNLFNMLNIVER